MELAAREIHFPRSLHCSHWNDCDGGDCSLAGKGEQGETGRRKKKGGGGSGVDNGQPKIRKSLLLHFFLFLSLG